MSDREVEIFSENHSILAKIHFSENSQNGRPSAGLLLAPIAAFYCVCVHGGVCIDVRVGLLIVCSVFGTRCDRVGYKV